MLHARLQSPDLIVFTTRDFAVAFNLSLSSASHQLRRLAQKDLLTPITRGLWANTRHPAFTPLAAVPALLGNAQGYVTFLTALHLHGLLSQIPTTVQVATTSGPRVMKSPIGTFEFFQLKPEMMRAGITWSDTQLPYRRATAEKALLDTLYLATRKGRRFASLPEIEMGRAFKPQRFYALVNKGVTDLRIKSAVLRRAGELFKGLTH